MIDLSLFDQMLSPDVTTRELALKAIGDYIEFNNWDPEDLKEVVDELQGRIAQEPELQVRKQIYRNIKTALFKGPIDIYWYAIIDFLKHPSATALDINQCLQILGYSREEEYKSVVKDFLNHAEELVRVGAQEALKVLD